MIDYIQYSERLMSVLDQFGYMRYIIDERSSKDRDYLYLYPGFFPIEGGITWDKDKNLKKPVEADVENIFTGSYANILKKYTKWIKSKESSTFFNNYILPSIKKPRNLKEIGNRLNQNEFILTFSILEVFLEDIYREILKQYPLLLKSDKHIKLGRILARGLDVVLKEEIENEVRSWSFDSVKDKVNRFKNRLKIELPKELIKDFYDCNETRNNLVHRDPDLEVKEESLNILRKLSLTLPLLVIGKAKSIYPKCFHESLGLPQKDK
ncbi:MAG TPA: hypothetical protein PLR20_14545 [Syntrophales bacterium]|jgi:hypothetical protein|nr:hypothetical protein [Syntrophales bacterium]HPN25791.1 hypothetical protein [Syntrophales bacterium]HQM30564.1 hypothetical protein [Syntrophales bacterium]